MKSDSKRDKMVKEYNQMLEEAFDLIAKLSDENLKRIMEMLK